MLHSWANFYARGGLGLGARGAEVGVGVVGKGELVLLRKLLGMRLNSLSQLSDRRKLP